MSLYLYTFHKKNRKAAFFVFWLLTFRRLAFIMDNVKDGFSPAAFCPSAVYGCGFPTKADLPVGMAQLENCIKRLCARARAGDTP